MIRPHPGRRAFSLCLGLAATFLLARVTPYRSSPTTGAVLDLGVVRPCLQLNPGPTLDFIAYRPTTGHRASVYFVVRLLGPGPGIYGPA